MRDALSFILSLNHHRQRPFSLLTLSGYPEIFKNVLAYNKAVAISGFCLSFR